MSNSAILDRFIEESKHMPWQIIEKIAFIDSSSTTVITFRSGNGIKASSVCKKQYEALKAEARNQLESSQIDIKD